MTRAPNRTTRMRERTGAIVVLGLTLSLLGLPGGGISTAAVSTPTAPQAQAQAAKFHDAKQAVGLTYKGGPTHPGPVYAGTWKNGPKGFCIDFDLPSPNSSGTKKLAGVVPGLDPAKSAQIKHIVNANVDTTSPQRAAYAQLAIWKLQDEPAFKSWYRTDALTGADRKAVDAVVADAAQLGPYKLSLKAGKVQVGQRGTGAVTVLRADGKPLVGRSVALSASGAKIVSVKNVAGHEGLSRAGGLAFAYERSKPGKVALKAVLTTPSSLTAGLSTTEDGHQRTLSGGYLETALANYAYDLTPGKPTITSACGSDCAGVSTVSFKVCNPAGAQAISWTEKVGGKAVATLTAAGGKCATQTAKVADGKTIAASYCYTKIVGGACAGARSPMAGGYEVVCPEWTKVLYELGCDCEGANGGTVTFTAPAGSLRFYRGFISVTRNGPAVVQPVDLTNGKSTKVEVGSLPKGGTVVISFAAYRDKQRLAQLGGAHVLRRMTLDAPA